jgi:hypothetical protein
MVNSGFQELFVHLFLLGNEVDEVLLGNRPNVDVAHLIPFKNVTELDSFFL